MLQTDQKESASEGASSASQMEINADSSTGLPGVQSMANTGAANTSQSPSTAQSVNTPQATSQSTLPGNSNTTTVSSGGTPPAPVEPPEILMEGAAPNVRRRSVSTATVSSTGYLYNLVLSSAIFLFIGLVLRRIFLLEGDTAEEIDEVLL